jgi:hypothetical protein
MRYVVSEDVVSLEGCVREFDNSSSGSLKRSDKSSIVYRRDEGKLGTLNISSG